MESKNLVICDPEEGYALALANYVMHRKELSLQVQVCSSIKSILSLAEEDAVDFLFLSDTFSAEERETITAGQLFLLTEKSNVSELDEIPAIFKYQSGEKIVEELIRRGEGFEENSELFFRAPGKKETEVIGIFSPVHRVGKTSFALKMGEEMAASANVLYLNLELYGGYGGHFEESQETLADVLYYAGQESGNLGLMLTTVVKHKNGLDYVLPMPVSEDLKAVTAKEWISLVEKILEQSIYETIILDIDEGIQGLYPLLTACQKVYVLTREEEIAQSKIRQLNQELELLGYEDLRRKITFREEEACRKQSSFMPES